MVTPVTMEIMVHSEMGRLDFVEEEEEGGKKGTVHQSWEHKFIK